MTAQAQSQDRPAMDAYRACEIAEGFGSGEDASYEDKREAWQYLHTSGLAYSLQGWYGRTARNLIARGVIKP
jgi:hypothetical protein